MGQVKNKLQLSVYIKRSTKRFIDQESKRRGLSKSQVVEEIVSKVKERTAARAAIKRLKASASN